MTIRRPSIIHSNRSSSIVSSRAKKRGLFARMFGAPARRHPRTRMHLHRDYVRKTFVNPYFHTSFTPKRTKAKRTKIFFVTAVCAAIVIIFLFHPFFDITSVQVQGNQKIQSFDIQEAAQEILNRRLIGVFKEKNFFLVNTSAIVDALTKRYAFDRVSVSASPFSTLHIIVSERAPLAIVKSGSPFYYIDKNGASIGMAPDTEISNTNFLTRLPQVWLLQEQNITLNTQVITPATLQFVIALFKMIPNETGVALQGATPQDEEGRILHLTTAEGWQIYVDRQSDWKTQVHVLKNILNTKFKDGNRAGLQYIDVRYENRAYVK